MSKSRNLAGGRKDVGNWRVDHPEERFRSIFEQAAVGIAQVSPDGRWLKVNRRLCEMLGKGEAELLYQGFAQSTHTEDLRTCLDLLAGLRAGRLDQGRAELRYHGYDGRLRWASASVSAVRKADDRLDYCVLVVQDISALKEAEAALRVRVDLNEYLAKIAGTLPGVIYSFRMRPDGHMSMPYATPSFAELCGLEPADVVEDASAAFARVHPDDVAGVRNSIVKSAQGMYQWQAEFRMLHPVRGEIWLEGRSTPEWEPDGSILWHGFLYDITVRKQHEARQRLAASVFASTQEGVVITDPNACIVAINPAFSTITGYDEQELVGKHMRIMQSGRQDAAFYQKMWQAIATRGSWQGEIWNRRKSGAIYPEWLTISAVQDEHGRVVNYVGSFSDITRLKESEERLRYLALHDALTGLPNREALLERLQQAVGRSQRSAAFGAVLFLDLDRFKNVNDSFGHPAGDDLLKQVAQRLTARLRNVDVLARLGGDEFVVLLEGLAGPADAATAAQHLIDAISPPFLIGDGKEGSVGCSIGISLFPHDARDAHQLIQQADAALYQAKSAGRGVYRFFETSLTLLAQRRLEVEAYIRRGLERREFFLHYQPLIDLRSGRIKGCEALLRWRSGNGTMVSPAELVSVAEETGLIAPLGEWVLQTACKQMRDWLVSGYDLDTMAVNLSPHQFRRADIVDRVHAILAEAGLEPGKLELEITEGALMEDAAGVEHKLRRLKQPGLRLSIDDFGTGYSSLAYLKRFPIDKLKIDRQFVRDIPEDPADMQIAAAVVSLAHNLGLEVLAEGVETAAQLGFLREHGCDTGQGFLFSKPLGRDDFLRLLGNRSSLLPEAA